MKTGIVIAIALASSLAFSDPTVFEMKLGTASEEELKSKYRMQHTGTNIYSNGNMYSISPAEINFDGLQGVTTIFDTEGVLVAVLASFPKSKFDYLNRTLSAKYELVSQNIPFVGNKLVTYRDGGTEIILEAPHMSFEMMMSYVQDDFMKTANQQRESAQHRNRQDEASQL